MRDTIGYGGAYIVGAASVYTHMGVLINWTQTYAPDSIQLLFNSSIKGIGAPAVGGKLYIDDVIMSSTNGIEQVSNNASFLAFPNPASNSIRISSENEHARYLTVYDVTGRILDKYEFFNKTVLADVQSYSNGLYVYAVTDDRNNLLFTAKFSVAR
jgi:hypothetical protein